MLDHTEDAIVACDADWRVTVWNEGARRIFGWTAEEAVGQPATFLRLDESDEQRMDRRRQLAEYGRWRGELMVERKDGSEVPVEAIGVAIRGEQGGISGYLGIHRDITERNRAEEALREAKRSSGTILESISDSFGALDADWRYTYMNRRALELAGKARGEDLLLADVLGRRIWDVFPQLVGTTIYHEYHRAVREQKTVVFETYSPVIDGRVEVHAYPSKDGGLSIYARDITERIRAQEQLAYHARLVENMEDGVIATDARFRVTAWNRGAGRLYGWTADEMLGRHVQDVIQTELSDEELALRFAQVAQQGRARSELVAYRKDGTTIDVELITVAIRGERGEVTGYVAIHRDISERKQSEEALRNANRATE
ncbi:MAG TPA: PAS domain S-box protein, partial [Solirubrobacteraceae bacterium]